MVALSITFSSYWVLLTICTDDPNANILYFITSVKLNISCFPINPFQFYRYFLQILDIFAPYVLVIISTTLWIPPLNDGLLNILSLPTGNTISRGKTLLINQIIITTIQYTVSVEITLIFLPRLRTWKNVPRQTSICWTRLCSSTTLAPMTLEITSASSQTRQERRLPMFSTLVSKVKLFSVSYELVELDTIYI